MTKEEEIAGLALVLEAAATGLLKGRLGPAAVAGIEAVKMFIEGQPDPAQAEQAFRTWVIDDLRAKFG